MLEVCVSEGSPALAGELSVATRNMSLIRKREDVYHCLKGYFG